MKNEYAWESLHQEMTDLGIINGEDLENQIKQLEIEVDIELKKDR
ncbi:hypothetical protein [Desulforamulus aeronauticus]|uniref:Uncharacterized protein n=1 Tax=Desulforamulus aeronauticus DSM 10349 TaxID=1121421 RepID=A0A1M6WK08_9FIRM|nr:hypothetical protein [Desulforamulus aeronauticus]SHK94048.1 hypothetical protein SAMN02745123_03667 [Desulforamulus aeronauticus DSM 10349]